MLGVLVINSTCKDKRNSGNHDIILNSSNCNLLLEVKEGQSLTQRPRKHLESEGALTEKGT